MSTEQASTNEQQPPPARERSQPAAEPAGKDHDQGSIIWTPRFMLLFAFVLVAGLSAESLLTQGWLNSSYSGQWVFQVHVILIGIAWLVLLVRARSRWVFIGAIFGLAWTACMTADITIQAAIGDTHVDVMEQVNILVCLSWLGCSICLAIDRSLLRPWDAWLLGLLPVVGALASALLFLFSREYSLYSLERSIATVAIVFSAVVWFARPSRWRRAPGLSVLFGLIPVILLGMDAANGWYNSINFFLARVVLYPQQSIGVRDTNFFFSQVALLCLLLGIMRLLKCELAN